MEIVDQILKQQGVRLPAAKIKIKLKLNSIYKVILGC